MKKDTVVIGILILLIGIVFIPISRVSETKRFSTSQTQTVANSLCPPPIITHLESGSYHIKITEDKIIAAQSARIVVYDQNNNIIFQSSILEGSDFVIKHDYDFVVQNSGIHNITLEDAGGFVVAVMTTMTIWTDVITYPFESLFYIGLAMVITGVTLMILGSVISSRRS
jgi:hypothetical protein